ncbi:MAG: AAA family ATPase [Pseudomonadota bacterium]|nr:AAA family ATPase [Pseudomonadota bacterium]
MDRIKRIPYGIGDFEQVNAKWEYYVDKTMYIPELEKHRFVFFIRPRRFGKTLFLSTLQSYYDINKKDRFEEFYRDTWILENPTEERARYMILYFNFSVVNKDKNLVQPSFNIYCSGVIDHFLDLYEKYIPGKVAAEVKKSKNADEKLSKMSYLLAGEETKIYLMIDEYDNFTNTIMAEYGREEYERISKEEGYFKQFFTVLKGIASGSGSALARMFITGVSPITMDDVTSGFNVGANLSTHPRFNTLMGFTETDVSEMIDYYTRAGEFHLDKNECLKIMSQWYNNYQFAEKAKNRVFNTDMILYFMRDTCGLDYMPNDLIDENVRVDYGKLKHLIAVNNNLNGNFNELENLLANGYSTARLKKSFPHHQLMVRDNFISLLFYFGLLTIDGSFQGETRFSIPNKVIESFMNEFITEGYRDACKVDISMVKLSRLIGAMAYDGEWMPCIEHIAELIEECLSVRDLIEGEKVVQTLFTAFLHAGRPFLISTEKESGGGFIDISLAPFLSLFPDMQYAYLIEMKYLKANELYNADIEQKTFAKAKAQLEKYANDENLRKQWHLDPYGEIELKRLILIFKGRELKHYSEY